MNRAQRRLKKRPTLAQVQSVFGGVELFAQQLIRGEVDASPDGTILYRDLEGMYYVAYPALEGLIETWMDIAARARLTFDFDALRIVCRRLEYQMFIEPELAKRFANVIAEMKKSYSLMNMYEVKEVVRAAEIRWRIAGDL